MNQKNEIPIVDLASTSSQSLAQAVVNALHDYGFFYVINHNISKELQSGLELASEKFFAQEEDQKLKFRMENAGLAWKGYFPVGAELTSGKPDRKEGLYFGTEIEESDYRVTDQWPMHGPNQWPSSAYQKVVPQYMAEVQKLAKKLLGLIGVGLGLEEEYFSQRFSGDPTCLFRIFSYPAVAESREQWGVQEHTDMGFLTILKQDHLGGLQVKDPEGKWIDAPPIENSFVINIGDMLELWTWGVLKATLHRVKNTSAKSRFSYPFFYDPSWNSQLERIDKSLLPQDLIQSSRANAEERWDKRDLTRISAKTTYGEFVWDKVKDVFPHLAKK